MDKAQLNKLLDTERACPQPSDLLSYSKNNSVENARKIELHIASCKLCSDAIEGFENADFPIEIDSKIINNAPKGTRFFTQMFIALITCSILALLYFLDIKATKEKTVIINESATIKSKEIRLEQNEIKIESNKIIDSTESKKEANVVFKNDVTIYPINKIRTNKLNENKISDSLITKNYSSPPKREFFKSAFPIKYVNELKAIDYQHLYEDIEEQNIPVLKSLDPRYENLKSKSDVLDNSTEQKLSYNEVLSTALLAFSNGDYETCERYFTLILNSYPDDQNAIFYTGVSFYKQNRISKAIPLLEKLSLRSSSPFIEEAQWNLANCYKEENRIQEMKTILQKLIDKNGFYSGKAKQLMNQF